MRAFCLNMNAQKSLRAIKLSSDHVDYYALLLKHNSITSSLCLASIDYRAIDEGCALQHDMAQELQYYDRPTFKCYSVPKLNQKYNSKRSPDCSQNENAA